MIDPQDGFNFLAHSWIFHCPITQQRVSVSNYKEFLTSHERTIWWFCQVCKDWHIFSHDSAAEGNLLNFDSTDDMMTAIE